MSDRWPDGTPRLPKDHCPECGYALDAASTPDGRKGSSQPQPKPGDITLCLKCAAVFVFDEQLRVRPLTEEEVGTILANRELNAELARISRAIKHVQRMHARRN
jgi:hypothetical protein